MRSIVGILLLIVFLFPIACAAKDREDATLIEFFLEKRDYSSLTRELVFCKMQLHEGEKYWKIGYGSAPMGKDGKGDTVLGNPVEGYSNTSIKNLLERLEKAHKMQLAINGNSSSNFRLNKTNVVLSRSDGRNKDTVSFANDEGDQFFKQMSEILSSVAKKVK
jgi:hypothetical protein